MFCKTRFIVLNHNSCNISFERRRCMGSMRRKLISCRENIREGSKVCKTDALAIYNYLVEYDRIIQRGSLLENQRDMIARSHTTQWIGRLNNITGVSKQLIQSKLMYENQAGTQSSNTHGVRGSKNNKKKKKKQKGNK